MFINPFFNAEKIIKASYGLLIILGVGSLAALVPLVPGLMQPCLAVLVVGNPWQPWYRLAALVLFVSLGTPCQPWYPLYHVWHLAVVCKSHVNSQASTSV